MNIHKAWRFILDWRVVIPACAVTALLIWFRLGPGDRHITDGTLPTTAKANPTNVVPNVKEPPSESKKILTPEEIESGEW